MAQPMLEIFLISVAVSLATSILRRRILTPEDMAKMAESQNYRKMLLEVQRKGDKKMLQKLMRKQDYYRKIDAEIGKKNIILLVASIAIFYIVFLGVLNPIYGGSEAVAILPGDMVLPFIGNKLSYLTWYVLCLFAINFPINKLFQAGPEQASPKKS
jgi:uncharacterized membrane protein (DUF106 family)